MNTATLSPILFPPMYHITTHSNETLLLQSYFLSWHVLFMFLQHCSGGGGGGGNDGVGVVMEFIKNTGLVSLLIDEIMEVLYVTKALNPVFHLIRHYIFTHGGGVSGGNGITGNVGKDRNEDVGVGGMFTALMSFITNTNTDTNTDVKSNVDSNTNTMLRLKELLTLTPSIVGGNGVVYQHQYHYATRNINMTNMTNTNMTNTNIDDDDSVDVDDLVTMNMYMDCYGVFDDMNYMMNITSNTINTSLIEFMHIYHHHRHLLADEDRNMGMGNTNTNGISIPPFMLRTYTSMNTPTTSIITSGHCNNTLSSLLPPHKPFTNTITKTNFPTIIIPMLIHILLAHPGLAKQWYTKLNSSANTTYTNTLTPLSSLITALDLELLKYTLKHTPLPHLSVTFPVSSTKSFSATYSRESISVTLNIVFSHTHPLTLPTVTITSPFASFTPQQLTKLRFQIISSLSSSKSTFYDLISLFYTSIDKHIDGAEDCGICFCIVCDSTHKLPNVECNTCHKAFHSVCLLNWFESAGKSSCPMCRQLF